MDVPKNNLKKILTERGLSGADFARQCGLHPTMISKVVNHAKNPGKESLQRICEALNITIEDFYNVEILKSETSNSRSTRKFNRVKEWLIRTGTTNVELANAVGVHHTSITMYKAQKMNPSMQVAAKMAEFFRIPVTEIFADVLPTDEFEVVKDEFIELKEVPVDKQDGEQWKPLQSDLYGMFYEISSLGRVKRLTREDSKGQLMPEHILKAYKNGSGASVVSVEISLFGRSSRTEILLGNEVASLFIEKPAPEYSAVWDPFSSMIKVKEVKYNWIEHIDGDIANCRVDNLKWINYQQKTSQKDLNRQISSNKLSEIILKRQITPTDIALDADINLQEMYIFLDNKAQPNPEQAKKLAEALDVGFTEIFD